MDESQYMIQILKNQVVIMGRLRTLSYYIAGSDLPSDLLDKGIESTLNLLKGQASTITYPEAGERLVRKGE